jgi:hypothetical protein
MTLSLADYLNLSGQGDSFADDVVSRIFKENPQQNVMNLFNLLIRNLHLPGDELPGYVEEYRKEASVLPDWMDASKIRRAERFFIDKGLACSVVLYYRSLPECYLIPSIAEVLMITGRMAGRNWPETYARRVGETTQFVLDVCSPGGIIGEGTGIETLVRVRLIHASIRHFIHKQQNWPNGQVAICQMDLVYTLLTFGFSMVDGLKTMGIEVNDKDAEAFFHLWSVAGHLLGIPNEYLPETPLKAKELLDLMKSQLARKTEAGIACTTALTAFSKDILAGQFLDDFPEAMVRQLIGESYGGMLGLRNNNGCMARLLPKVLMRLLSWSEALEDRIPATNELTDPLGAAILKGMRSYFQSYKGNGIRLHEEIESAWALG